MAKHPRQLERGALTLGLWLLAIATASAVQSAARTWANDALIDGSTTAPAAKTGGYLPALGAAPLLFQTPAVGGRPEGLLLLSLRSDRGTNATTPVINAPVSSAAGATNEAVLPAAAAVPPPARTASADTNQFSLPPMNEPVPVGSTVTDMQSVLKWLLPASGNGPDGNRLFPVFAPATPPRSSSAVYQSR